MGFFEVRCGTSSPLPFSLFLALFLGILPVARLSDERRALGEYRLLLTELPILLGFMLEGVVFLFLTFLSGVLAKRGRHDDWRVLVGVLFLLGVLLNYE
jgi:predicted permease